MNATDERNAIVTNESRVRWLTILTASSGYRDTRVSDYSLTMGVELLLTVLTATKVYSIQ